MDPHKPIVFIPVKEISKRCPVKNWGRKINGQSLLERAINMAKTVLPAEQVVVCSSSQALLDIAYKMDVAIVLRPDRLDESDLEYVMQWFIEEGHIPDSTQIILLQVTNPFIKPRHLTYALSGRVMGVAHCGAFYGQSSREWLQDGLDNKNRFSMSLVDPSVDIDTEDDFIKAKKILEE